MSKRVALQMDPLEAINPRSDSTLLLGLEAQVRGYEVFHYTPDQLSWREGKITARAHRVTLHADHEHHYDFHEEHLLDLAEMDVILLRQDPPFNMHYLTTTYLLEQLHPKTLVVNNPKSVRDFPEKIFPTLLRQFMPPTLISADLRDIEAFRKDYKDIIIKPLYGYGGRSVLRITPGDDNFQTVLEMHFATSNEPLMIQAFLPEVKTGDRRVILIDGKYAGVVGRIPAEHEIRANFRVGGTAAKVELSKKQMEICEALEPMLRDNGLIFAGIDLIGDWLTEVNLTSPTGLVPINQLYGAKLEAGIWNAIEAYL